MLAPPPAAADGAPAPASDGEAWNRGVDFYRAGDATNALRVLRPLTLSKSHGARAAELVAKLAYEAGDREEAAAAAQIALRAAPDDARANRNFTRAADGLLEARATKHVNDVLKASQGKDPAALLLAATADARRLFSESATYRTNSPARAVARADKMEADARRLADALIPLRQFIEQSVTNEEQAAAMFQQIKRAEAKAKAAARALGDMDDAAYPALSEVESDFTSFLKTAGSGSSLMYEDLVAQSNAWLDVEAFNGRSWQRDALDYTRSFRAKFPAWAKEYEQRAQADTNMPPFSAEDQAKVAALAVELEKLQLGSVENSVPPDQEKAIKIIETIRELMPKDKGGGGQDQPQQSPKQGQDKQQPQDDQKQDDQNQDDGQQGETDERQTEDPQDQPEDDQDEGDGEGQEEQSEEDKEVEATLKRAQERSDEHEADKRARMRKAPLPPNERDW